MPLSALIGRLGSQSLLAAPAFLLCAALPLAAQTPGHPAASSLPATPTTAAPAPAPAPPPPAPAHQADVTFADGKLTVRADNSSLHQILYSISRLTGMTITGGVEDQRVFGSYGPGDASSILATLLDGTGVNMLIREGDSHQPTSLILTPRSGAAGPPITAQDAAIGSSQPVSAPGDMHVLAPGASMPLPSSTEPPPDTSAPANTAAQNNTDTTSPAPGNGALTPAEVYQRLLNMQKARSGAPAGDPPSSGNVSGSGTPQ